MFSPKALIFIIAVLMCVKGVTADSKCRANFGFCQEVENSCSGSYLSYLCDGSYTRKCCVPAFNDVKCHARDGKCQSTSITCFGGSYVTGLCGGPLERRCCISNFTDSAYNDEKCQTKGGKCRYTNIACVDGSYVSNLCGGPTNRLCCLPTAYNDEKCQTKGGECQYTNITCVGGNYVSNLCGGPANRRCCLPQVSECGEQAQRLACQLIESSNVVFLGRQTSSATDTPEANLKDMCNGTKAIRSKDRCDSGCNEVRSKLICLYTPLLQYLVALQDSGRVAIDELTGACHKHSCRHQAGRAVDLHRDGRTPHYIRQCYALGGFAEPRASVVHCQF